MRSHIDGPLAMRGRVGLRIAAALGSLALLAGCRQGKPADPPGDTGKSGESAVHLIRLGAAAGVEMGAESLKLAGVSAVVAGDSVLGAGLEPTGEVAPTDSGTVQVTSRLPGRIVATYVAAGASVRKGQTIAEVDSVDLTTAQAAYQTALSHMQLTLHQLDQQRKLAKYGTLSEPAIEDARRSFAAAQAAVNNDQAQIEVDRLTLNNTRKLVDMGEITRKPVEDAQNAFAQAQSAAVQARVTLHSAKANLDRATVLYANGVYSRQQHEDAQAAYDSAVAATEQTATQQKLADEELTRQRSIYAQNLNGASSLQGAQTKLQQDQHTYDNDVTALGLARRALQRAEVVLKSGIPVSQALQQAQDAYDEAKVTLQGAANTLRLYGVEPAAGTRQLVGGRNIISVVAPLDGIVASRSMVVGQMTDTSTPLVRILNLDRVYVDAQVFERDLADVAVGSRVSLRVAAFPGRAFAGTVSYIGHEVSADTRTTTVRTVIANPGWLLRPGMFATVRIGGREGPRALAIPEQAVMQEGTGQVVYVQVADRQFVKRKIKVGPAAQGRVPVYSGLTAGDRVVVTGNLFLESAQEKLENEKRGTA